MQRLPYLERALSVARVAGLVQQASWFADNVAAARITVGDWDRAQAANNEARKLKTQAGDTSLVYNTLNDAQIALGRGQLGDASRLFNDTLRAAADDPSLQWLAHAGLADVARSRKDGATTVREFEATLRHNRAHTRRSAQDRLQALVSDASHPLLPCVRRCPDGRRTTRTRPRDCRFEPRPCAGRAGRRIGADAADERGIQTRGAGVRHDARRVLAGTGSILRVGGGRRRSARGHTTAGIPNRSARRGLPASARRSRRRSARDGDDARRRAVCRRRRAHPTVS